VKKKRRLALATAGIALIIVGAISAGLLFRPSPQPGNTTETAAADNVAQKTIINVISTKSAFPFVQRWAAQYDNEQSFATVQVSYLEDADLRENNNLAIVGGISARNNNSYIPVSAQAVAIVYNLPSFPDIPSGLKLDSNLLSRIFNGSITEWDDAAIKNLNPDLNLPNNRIVVFHEDIDSRSSTTLLKRYLSFDAIRWSNSSIVASGPDELAAMVRKTPYSIGYVDFSYAIQTKMTFAAIANPHGEYITPSIDSIGQAANSSMQIQNASSINQTAAIPPMINSSRLGNSSYPIVGLYYAALADNAGAGSRNATLDFVRWIINDNGGQQTLSEVQYPPIYRDNEPLAAYAETIIMRNNTIGATKD
jgi:ABC-type phosphate transport system substrate-binding protein